MSEAEQLPGALWLEGPSILEAVSRYRWVVLTLAVLGAALGYTYASFQVPIYEASARLLLTDPQSTALFDESPGPQSDPDRYIRNQAALIESGPVFVEAATEFDELGPRALAGHTTVLAEDGIDMLTIVARDASPERAAEMANAVAEAYQDVVARTKQQSAQNAIEQLEARNERLRERIAGGAVSDDDTGDGVVGSAAEAERQAEITTLLDNESRIEQLLVDTQLFGSGVQNYAPAGVPSAPLPASPMRPTAIGLVLGAVLGTALAWRLAMSRGVDTGEEAGRILGVPMLGEIPDMGSSKQRSGFVPTLSAPLSVEAEAYHYVAAALELSLPQLAGTTVLVTSVASGDGKTVMALNLALALGQDGTRVLLADADERKRGLSKFVDAAPRPGLRELIREGTPIAACVQHYRVRDDITLEIIAAPAQAADPAAFYRTRGMGRVLERLKGTGQLVFIDSPPLLTVSETLTLAGQADAVMLVVSRGTSPRELRRALHRFDLVGASVCGFVFNRAKAEGHRAAYEKSYAASTQARLKPDNPEDASATTSASWFARIFRRRSASVSSLRGTRLNEG